MDVNSSTGSLVVSPPEQIVMIHHCLVTPLTQHTYSDNLNSHDPTTKELGRQPIAATVL